jgi:hypothetical protein
MMHYRFTGSVRSNWFGISGKSEKEPNMYPFGTSYDEIYEDLKKKVSF